MSQPNQPTTPPRLYTVACLFPDYSRNEVTVLAHSPAEACEQGLLKANASPDWKRCDQAGPAHVDALYHGYRETCAQPKELPVPGPYTETSAELASALRTAIASLTAERDCISAAVCSPDSETNIPDPEDAEILAAMDAEILALREILNRRGYTP